jgi:predicted transcriptional regulator
LSKASWRCRVLTDANASQSRKRESQTAIQPTAHYRLLIECPLFSLRIPVHLRLHYRTLKQAHASYNNTLFRFGSSTSSIWGISLSNSRFLHKIRGDCSVVTTGTMQEEDLRLLKTPDRSKRRSSVQLIAEILETARTGSKKSRMISRIGMSCRQFSRYLEFLSSRGLIWNNEGVCQTSPKGASFLRGYKTLLLLLSDRHSLKMLTWLSAGEGQRSLQMARSLHGIFSKC